MKTLEILCADWCGIGLFERPTTQIAHSHDKLGSDKSCRSTRHRYANDQQQKLINSA